VYPLDYGYLEGTTAVDGNAVDVWIGSLEPRRVTGAAVCVDSHKADVEIKVLLGCTADQIELVGRVHNEKGQSALLVWRD
jgi:inorganic pyrophosphatase